MDRTLPIVDRELERAQLEALADSGQRRLALLYGRRRVGKTYLLTNLWGRDRAFYFTASATSPEINRRGLIREASRWSGRDLRPKDHPTWRTVFRTLLELRPQQNLVVVLDEVQYMASGGNGLLELTSELNAVWEGPLNRSGGVLLVLAGSAVRTLEALESGGAPLHGRLDWSHQLRPFDYYDAGHMIAAYGPVDRVRTYAAFGGVPKYLSLVDTSKELAENIIGLLLSPNGSVRLQLENVLAQEEGLRDRATYQGILQAIGTKRRRNGEIAAAMGLTLDSGVRRMTSHLADLGFIAADRRFDEARNQALRYRIADPALRMHYGLVVPNESAIATAGPRAVWQERLSKQVFPTYVGQHVFEDVVRQAYVRHWEARDLPGVAEWGQWSGRDLSRDDVEIDVVARLLDGRVMTGSVKMQNRLVDATVFLKHVTDLQRLADSGLGWAHKALEPGAPMLFVSSSGFKESFVEVAGELPHPLVLWEARDLF